MSDNKTERKPSLRIIEFIGDGNAVLRFTDDTERLVPAGDVAVCGAADAEPEMAEPFPNRTWPWRMEDCDQEATAERRRQCYVYPDRAFQEIERLRERVRWYAGVLSRTEISAAIAADAVKPKEPSGE